MFDECSPMFKDPDGLNKLCKRVKAIVEEFGPDNVIIYVPHKWKDYPVAQEGRLGRVELRFLNAPLIRVEAFNDNKMSLRIDEELTAT